MYSCLHQFEVDKTCSMRCSRGRHGRYVCQSYPTASKTTHMWNCTCISDRSDCKVLKINSVLIFSRFLSETVIQNQWKPLEILSARVEQVRIVKKLVYLWMNIHPTYVSCVAVSLLWIYISEAGSLISVRLTVWDDPLNMLNTLC